MNKQTRKIRVCHITTVHQAFDVRIFHKECKSLAQNGYSVFLITRHEKDDIINGVSIIALPQRRAKGMQRALSSIHALIKGVKLQADVYHIHDPELLPIGVALKLFTRGKVIYDVHEDVVAHAMGKRWHSPFSRKLEAMILRTLEICCSLFLDAIIVVVDSLEKKFRKQTTTVKNYPILDQINRLPNNYSQKNHCLIYVGTIRETRNPFGILRAIAQLKVDFPEIELYMVGSFFPPSLEEKLTEFVKKNNLKDHVFFTGRVPHQQAMELIRKADIGIDTPLPYPNDMLGLPTKMFEYMLLGKPVVVSNFQLRREIVEQAGCGVMVNPEDEKDITMKISDLLLRAELRKEMGQKGREAVLGIYNWKQEEKKLLSCYERLI